MVRKLSIYGSGAFGFALARHLGNKFLDDPDYKIYLYGRNKKIMRSIAQTKKHPFHFDDISLPKNIVLTTKIKDVVKDAYIILLAVPSNSLKSVLNDIKDFTSECSIILNTAKGLELKTNKRLSEIIKEELNNQVAVFSGGTISEDMVHDSYLGAEVGCEDHSIALQLEDVLKTDRLRVYANNDLAGVEYAGAFKNVVSIAAGISDGLQVTYGSKTYLITQASEEAKKLAVKLGAKDHTFSSGSQSWTNDLWMSCTGNTRNRYFGELIGKGHTPKKALKILKSEHKIAEGFQTTKAVHHLSKKQGLYLPILENVYQILYKNKNPKDLMSL